MRFAVKVEDRCFRVIAEAQSSSLMSRSSDRNVLAQIEFARNQTIMKTDLREHALELCPHAVVRIQVNVFQRKPNPFVRIDGYPIGRIRQILRLQPEVDGMLRQVIERKLRLLNSPSGRLSIDHFAIRLAQHLYLAQGIFPIRRAQIKIV